MKSPLRIAAVLVGVAASVASVTTASAAKSSTVGLGDAMYLHSYNAQNRNITDEVTGPKLKSQQWYVVTVSGAVSYYAAHFYKKPEGKYNTVCGNPVHALIPGQDPTTTPPAGIDAEFVFARPWKKDKCGKLPVHWSNFALNTYNWWRHLAPAGPYLTAPNPDHTYSYYVRGEGHAIQFHLSDPPRSDDNYGDLKIVVRKAAASDCVNYEALDFASQPECESGMGGAPAVTPAAG
jgi:hypothetical protein